MNFKIIQTMPVTPLDIFMLLNGLIQMHIKCSRVFESIFYTYYEYNSKFKYNNDLNSVLKIFLKMFIIFGLVQNPCQNITNII